MNSRHTTESSHYEKCEAATLGIEALFMGHPLFQGVGTDFDADGPGWHVSLRFSRRPDSVPASFIVNGDVLVKIDETEEVYFLNGKPIQKLEFKTGGKLVQWTTTPGREYDSKGIVKDIADFSNLDDPNNEDIEMSEVFLWADKDEALDNAETGGHLLLRLVLEVKEVRVEEIE